VTLRTPRLGNRRARLDNPEESRAYRLREEERRTEQSEERSLSNPGRFTLPAVPVYCRVTHADASPSLRNPVSAMTSAVS
jgi:hypothetical protein